MPYYEFVCPDCHRKITAFISIKEESKFKNMRCKCGKIARRIISETSFHLKGGGWARDGYDKTSKAS